MARIRNRIQDFFSLLKMSHLKFQIICSEPERHWICVKFLYLVPFWFQTDKKITDLCEGILPFPVLEWYATKTIKRIPMDEQINIYGDTSALKQFIITYYKYQYVNIIPYFYITWPTWADSFVQLFIEKNIILLGIVYWLNE